MLKTKLNFAAIDIGSNAVRLLIKGIDEGEGASQLAKLQLVRVPLRLGEDAFVRGEITEDKQRRLIRTMRAFAMLMKVYNVVSYRACATSAMRDATNGRAIAEEIARKTGIELEVISGDEEARIVYDSHIGDLLPSGGDYLYVDVGGGSTEVSLICKGALVHSHSYNIGTVRSLSGGVSSKAWAELKMDMIALKLRYPTLGIIGSGGNINKIYRMKGRNPQQMLRVSDLEALYSELKPLSVEERMSRYQLNADRADVIIPASEIFLCIAEQLGVESIFVPTIGVSDGITQTLCTAYLAGR